MQFIFIDKLQCLTTCSSNAITLFSRETFKLFYEVVYFTKISTLLLKVIRYHIRLY
jgi:hypothetical protein